MQLGFHLANLTWPDGAASLGADLARVAHEAEESGVKRLTVMDHVWQISAYGPPEKDMLEAYTTLGFLAAHTSEVLLHTLVTGVVYREAGLLAKIVSTLDVLSGGRAGLGIGAAWNEEESRGLGLPFPPIKERFERLEEAIRISLQMWSEETGPFDGVHYSLAETLNSPASVSRPHPPLLIGGKGERKTLRIAAQYAQIVNLTTSDPDEAAHLLDVLRRHCDALGTDYDAIEKQVMGSRLDPADDGFWPTMQRFADLGIDLVVFGVRPNAQQAAVDALVEDVVPRLAAL